MGNYQSKKISKTAEDYIEALLSKLQTNHSNDKTLNNTYSYTRQLAGDNGRRDPRRNGQARKLLGDT